MHSRATDGSLFYVGKGVKKRAWHTFKRNRWWNAIYKKNGRNVHIVTGMIPEGCALTIEKILIQRHRSEICNLSEGGQGVSGYKHTEESLARMRAAKVGYRPKRLRPEQYRAIGEARRGTKMSEESRAKMSVSASKRKASDEARANMSRARKGKPHSAEWVRKQADAQRGKKLSDEQKAAIGNFHRGKKLSDAHIKAISTAVLCSNGMTFRSAKEAARWVRNNHGFPKASGTNILHCVRGRTSVAYGLNWTEA